MRRTALRSTGQASNSITHDSTASAVAPESMALPSLAWSATRPSSVPISALRPRLLSAVRIGGVQGQRNHWRSVCVIARVPAGDGVGSNAKIEFRPESFVEVGRFQRNQLEGVLAARDADDVPPV